jgi:hypothetical protein
MKSLFAQINKMKEATQPAGKWVKQSEVQAQKITEIKAEQEKQNLKA